MTLKAELERFRSTRAVTLAIVSGLAQEQMDYSPGAAKWSAGELVDHMLLAEKMYRDELTQFIKLKRAGSEPVISRTFADMNVSIAYIPRSLLPFLDLPFTVFNMFVPNSVREFLMRNRLIPAQNPRAATPRKGRPASELRDELVSSLKETEELFVANSDLDYTEMIDRHPLMGANNALQLLRLLSFHEQRHQSQISEVLNNLKSVRSILRCEPGNRLTNRHGNQQMKR